MLCAQMNGDGRISYDEMLQIVTAIYKMTGQMVKLPQDEDTPEKVRPPTPLSFSRISLAFRLRYIMCYVLTC